jgi:hypothetical protein
MEALLKSKNFSSVNKKTIEWKLRHCRQCPVCSIMINREEGCNKVDCPFCGYAFCWACQSPWSEVFCLICCGSSLYNVAKLFLILSLGLCLL